MKRKLVIIISLSFSILIIGSIIVFNRYKEKRFIESSQEFKINAARLAYLSEYIIEEYSDIWGKAISSSWVTIDGEQEYFSDFNSAISYKHSKNKESGIYNILDSLKLRSDILIKTITPPPTKYEMLYSDLKGLYTSSNDLASLAKSPKGSLIEFNKTTTELFSKSQSHIKNSEITLSITLETEYLSTILDAKNAMSSLKERAELAAVKELELKYADNKVNSEKFLKENKSKVGVVTHPSGLQYKVLKQGVGRIPTLNDQVEVFYKGFLTDGTMFETNIGKESAKFGVGQIIKGWSEALQLMPVGSKWILYIPSDLAYGTQQAGTIPPFSTLIFELELISIK